MEVKGLPRSLHYGPRRARASGRDDSIEEGPTRRDLTRRNKSGRSRGDDSFFDCAEDKKNAIRENGVPGEPENRFEYRPVQNEEDPRPRHRVRALGNRQKFSVIRFKFSVLGEEDPRDRESPRLGQPA